MLWTDLALAVIFILTAFISMGITGKNKWYLRAFTIAWMIKSALFSSPEDLSLNFFVWFLIKAILDREDLPNKSGSSYFDELAVQNVAQAFLFFIMIYFGVLSDYEIVFFVSAFSFATLIELDEHWQRRTFLCLPVIAIIVAFLFGAHPTLPNSAFNSILTLDSEWSGWLAQFIAGVLLIGILQTLRALKIAIALVQLIKTLATVTMLIPREIVLFLGLIFLILGFLWTWSALVVIWLIFVWTFHKHDFATKKSFNLSFLMFSTGAMYPYFHFFASEPFSAGDWAMFSASLYLFGYFSHLEIKKSLEQHVSHTV